MIMLFLTMLAAAAPAPAATPAKIAARYGFAGEILIAKGNRIVVERVFGSVAPGGKKRHRTGQRWRLASITKQVTAVQVMQVVERGRLTLDRSLEPEFGSSLKGITARMLLQHHSGLANADDTPTEKGQLPSYYRALGADKRSRAASHAYCVSLKGTPDAAFAYNNCDYRLLGELIPALPLLGRYGGRTVPGFVGGKPEPRFNLLSFGAAGALTGTARELFRFDRSLMTGKFLSSAARAELWKPEGGRSYQALGQWVFPATLKGCTAPKRVVQRDGEIGGVQTRNFIFPDDDLIVILFTNRSADDFAIGEVWQGKGFAYDLLSKAACP